MSSANDAFKFFTFVARYHARLQTYAELGAPPAHEMQEQVLGMSELMKVHAASVRPLQSQLADAMDTNAKQLAEQAEVLGDMQRDGIAVEPTSGSVLHEAAVIATQFLSVMNTVARAGAEATGLPQPEKRVLH